MARTSTASLLVDEVHEPSEVRENDSQGRFRASSHSTALAGFQAPLDLFLQSLEGRNSSPLTIRAYGTDLRQFFDYLTSSNPLFSRLDEVTQDDIHEFLASLAKQGRSGVTRARKLASIRELFRFLADTRVVESSPAQKVGIPKKERRSRVYLRPDEYMRMLSAAGSNSRDYAILQFFLQTGIRVSELANLQLAHLDLQAKTLHVAQGKGQKDRVIELEKKGLQALKNYLRVRPPVFDQHLFLNYEGHGLSVRGVQDIVEKYARQAGITKKISCHSLRHTFATHKARQGVSAFQLKEWLGHSSITTTQLYVHMGEDARRLMEATSL
jgi:site-specific recombinase XerD